MKQLIQHLQHIDGKGYKAYKRIQGYYTFADFDLFIDYVQGDPFATPSKIRICIPTSKRTIKPMWLQPHHRKVATEDAFARVIGKAVSENKIIVKGSGKSGRILFDSPGQEILERSAVQITPESITVCLSVGLPANGRRINGKEAEKLFCQAVPEIIRQSVFKIDEETINKAITLSDQQQAIRKTMRENGWVAFIANGAVLPRESGISNRPLKNAVPFQSPEEKEVAITIPYQEEPLRGMAISKGITLIVGGGYHGKSTLLEAIERGVYEHVQGDGREYVLTDPDAVKIRAEDGRQITGVNISPFINNLPHGQDTTSFTTENASGSTSQAANVMEALEAGATTLLVDEDTSATNFMIRDHRMQQLVHQDQEPITPFIDKVVQMRDELGVSTILVMGGSGDYFAVADAVIKMEAYVPYDATDEAKAIMKEYPSERDELREQKFGTISQRCFQPDTLQTRKGKKKKTQAKGLRKIVMGHTDIDFASTEQLVDPSQTRMIAEIIQFLDRTNGLGHKRLSTLLDEIEKQMDEKGLASFTLSNHEHPGDIARPRRHEIAAVFNRMRTAQVVQQTER
ncbi:MAG TPA: ABC-ATPase domain-containing protein [Bacillota bacterium]|nr:ABC-ATPase domain-containing protein [Bacillota bacterium]